MDGEVCILIAGYRGGVRVGVGEGGLDWGRGGHFLKRCLLWCRSSAMLSSRRWRGEVAEGFVVVGVVGGVGGEGGTVGARCVGRGIGDGGIGDVFGSCWCPRLLRRIARGANGGVTGDMGDIGDCCGDGGRACLCR